MANYPGSLPALNTAKTDGTTTAGDHAANHNAANDEINAIGAELGTDASGPYAPTVKERFEIMAFKPQSCKFSTTATLAATYANGTAGVGATLTASPGAVAPTTDGQTWVVGDRVLVKNQTTPAQNGIYVVTQITSPWILTRHYDADTSAKIADCKVLVDQGLVNGDTEWYQSATAPTVGTTPLYFRRTQPIYGHGNPRPPWGFAATTTQVIAETLPRSCIGATSEPTGVSAIQLLYGGLVVPAGRTVTNINFIASAAGAAPTVSWLALARQSDRVVMCHTANITSAPTVNVITTRAFTAAWTPIEDTPVWAVLSYAVATTAMQFIAGPPGPVGAIFLIAPAQAASNGVAPTTTVPTDGTTVITAGTTGRNTTGYFWLT